MKIAILTEILSTHSGARAPIELAKNLSGNNQITLISYAQKADQQLKKELEKLGIKIALVTPPRLPFGRYLAIKKFCPILQNQQIISFHGTPPTFLAAKLSGRPLVQTYYGTQLNAYQERFLPGETLAWKQRFANWLVNQLTFLIQRLYLSLSPKSVAISHFAQKEVEHLYGKKISCIPLGASHLLSGKNQGKSDQFFANHLPTLISVSRITPYKGFHLIIKAIKQSKIDCNLLLVGSAPQPKYLRYLEQIKTPNTEILIDVSDQELADIYRLADLYVSADRYLFFGLPPLEAAFWGKPSLLMNYGAAKESVVQGKTGYVANNLAQFGAYLKLLLKNPDLRKKMGQEAQKRAKARFSWTTTAENYQRLFEIVRLRSL